MKPNHFIIEMNFAANSLLFLVFGSAMCAPPEQNYDKQFNSLAATIGEASKKLEELSKVDMSFNQEKFSQLLKEIGNKMADDFKKLDEKLKTDSQSIPEDLKSKYTELVGKLQSAIKDLSSPEAAKKGEELQKQVLETLKVLGSQTNELAKNLGLAVPEKFQITFSELFNELSKAAKNIQNYGADLLEGMNEKQPEKQ